MPRQRRRLKCEKKRVLEYIKEYPTATVKQINAAITPSLPSCTLDAWLRNNGYKKVWRKVDE